MNKRTEKLNSDRTHNILIKRVHIEYYIISNVQTYVLQIARGMEAAQKSSQVVKVPEGLVQKVQYHGSNPAQS